MVGRIAVWSIAIIGSVSTACSGGDRNDPPSVPDARPVPDAGPLRSGTVAVFTINPTYSTGGTVTLIFDEARPNDQFQLEFRDFGFRENTAADVALYLGVGTHHIFGARLSGNLVGHVDTIPARVGGFPPVETRPDGTQVITVPASFGYTVEDFDSIFIYCTTFNLTVSTAVF